MGAVTPPRPSRRPAPARLLGLALLLCALAGASAPRGAVADDVVVLRNGGRLTGTVVEEGADGLVLEQTSGSSRTRMKIPRAQVARVERGAAPLPVAPGAPTAPPPEGPALAPRDEWWLLRSAGKVVGTRHLLTLVTEEGGTRGWRLEERISIFSAPRLPGVLVQRIEDTTEDFRPRFLHYRERGEGDGAAGGSPPYEILRTGPVRELVWEVSERRGDRSTASRVSLPEQARGPLGVRELVTRARPRRAGLAEMPLVDAAMGVVRVVRAGFVSLGVGGTTRREDLLRLEDGDRTLESRWVQGDPPRCVLEEVSPGVVAEPASEAQVSAAAGPEAAFDPLPSPGAAPPAVPRKASLREVVVTEAGFSFALPGASWVEEALPPPLAETGPRVVARASSKLHAADVRVEYDPAASPSASPSPAPAAPEAPLLARLRALAPDLGVAKARAEVPGMPGAWRMQVVGTLRGEKIRTLLLRADRGGAQVTVFVSCPEAAWADAEDALESIPASFRWL